MLKGDLLIGSNTDADTSNIYSPMWTPAASWAGHTVEPGTTPSMCIVQTNARKGNTGGSRPAGRYPCPAGPPAQDDPFEFTPLWVDTDDDLPSVPPEVQVGTLKPVEDSVLIWIDTGV